MAPTAKSPLRVTFAPITQNNVGAVRKLNSVLFPIRYSTKFYNDILGPDVEDFCKLGASSAPSAYKYSSLFSLLQ